MLYNLYTFYRRKQITAHADDDTGLGISSDMKLLILSGSADSSAAVLPNQAGCTRHASVRSCGSGMRPVSLGSTKLTPFTCPTRSQSSDQSLDVGLVDVER